MEIVGTISTFDTPAPRPMRRYASDGSFCAGVSDVQRENLLDVYVNDVLAMRLTCSLGHLPELVVGRLYTVSRDSDSRRKTRGTHSCHIARGDEVLCCREDVGRHNALDKAVGSALLAGVDLGECIAFTSGRVPTDMAIKAVRARIPVLASKTSATDQALDLARMYRLTLACRASANSLDVLNDPWREEMEARSRTA